MKILKNSRKVSKKKASTDDKKNAEKRCKKVMKCFFSDLRRPFPLSLAKYPHPLLQLSPTGAVSTARQIPQGVRSRQRSIV